MGFMDELKKLTRPYADDDDDFEEDFGLEEEEAASKRSTARERAPRAASRPAFRSNNSYDEVLESLGEGRSESAPTYHAAGNVVNLSSVAGSARKMAMVKPDRFEQVEDIAKKLRENCTVILNLEVANKDVARRIVDFLSGCAYALDGRIEKAAVLTYVITPRGVDIINEINNAENGSAYL